MNTPSLKLGLVLAITVGAFDEMAITTVLPLIVADLGGEQLYGAAFSAFVLASLFGTVWAGTRCDLTGPRKPFILGLLIFAAGLLIASLAPNMWVFVLSRAVQGLGNGILMALVFAVVNLAYDERERPKALALLSAAWVIPSLISPTGAGAMAEFVHWRWIFPSLMPVLLLAALLTLPVLKPYDLKPGKKPARGTLWSAFRLSLGIALILTAISYQDLHPVFTLTGILAGLALSYKPFGLFMPKGIWRISPGLATAMALRFCLNFIFFGAEVFLPYMLIQLYDFSALEAGFVLTSSALSWALGSWLQAKYNQVYSPAIFMLAGGLLMAFAIFGITAILLWSISIYWVFFFWAISGFAVGLAFTCISSYTMNHTESGKEGASASAAGVSSSLGIGLATGFAGAIFNHSQANNISLASSMISVWSMALLVCLAFLLIVWFRVRKFPTGLTRLTSESDQMTANAK